MFVKTQQKTLIKSSVIVVIFCCPWCRKGLFWGYVTVSVLGMYFALNTDKNGIISCVYMK